MNITKYKKDIYTVASINANKSLIYQSIPVVTKEFIFVISPTITLIEDQVCIIPEILYIYYLHLIVWFYILD